MIEQQRMVVMFHKKYRKKIGGAISAKELFHNSRLIGEECTEHLTAAQLGDIVEVTDALADIIYVCNAAAVSMGVDLEPVFAEIHKSNMTKHIESDKGGKITKGPDYKRPNVRKILMKQGFSV